MLNLTYNKKNTYIKIKTTSKYHFSRTNKNPKV